MFLFKETMTLSMCANSSTDTNFWYYCIFFGNEENTLFFLGGMLEGEIQGGWWRLD